jgi:hypothetical protein
VLALDNRAACDDLSGLDSSAFRFQVQLSDFDNRFYPFFLILRQDFLPAQGKRMFLQKNTYLCEPRIPHPLPPSWLLAGFISDISQRPPSFTYANSVHLPAQNIALG